MTCEYCKVEFCYLCGVDISGKVDEHFRRGVCNQFDSFENFMYDDFAPWDDFAAYLNDIHRNYSRFTYLKLLTPKSIVYFEESLSFHFICLHLLSDGTNSFGVFICVHLDLYLFGLLFPGIPSSLDTFSCGLVSAFISHTGCTHRSGCRLAYVSGKCGLGIYCFGNFM